MIIYKCAVFGFELFTDALKPKLLDDGTDCFTWESKMVSEEVGKVDDSLLGGNASQEEASESLDSAVKQGFDFEVYNPIMEKLEPQWSLKDFKLWFKQYAKKVLDHYKAKGQDEKAEAAKASATNFFKKFADKDKIKNFDFFSGPAQDDEELGMVNGNVIIVDWNDDGVSAKCTCWSGGLEAEKF